MDEAGSEREAGAASERELPQRLYVELERILGLAAEAQDDEVELLARGLPEHRAALWREVARARNLTGAVPTLVPVDIGRPERIGRYRVLATLKTGGMGRVFAAEDPELGRRVAIKTLRPDLLAYEVLRKRFQREMAMLSRLEHPCICRLYEVGVDHGLHFMALELVEGVDLDTVLERRRSGEGTGTPLFAERQGAARAASRRDVGRIVAYFEEAARAVHFAHEHGLVHRDLKPGNLMVRATGQPVILDYGLALEVEQGLTRLSRSDERVGTPAFMSPEQLAGRNAPIDCRTDVWSLGVSLFETLTLRLPFEGSTREETALCIRVQEPLPLHKLNPEVPRDVEAVVQKALEKDPRRRYASALELAEDLRRVIRGEPVRARRAGRLVRSARWARRNPLAALLLATLSTGLAATTWEHRRAAVQGRLAERHQSRFDLLAALIDLDRLETDAERLFPPWPENSEPLRAWLEQEREQRRVGAELERLLAEGFALPSPDAAPQDDSPTIGAFLRESLDRMLPRVRGLGTTTRERVEADLLWSERVEELSLRRHGERWRRARAAIAASAAYGARSVDLAPQMGLVPIGENPGTGLWEFYHLRSAWDAAGGGDPAAIEVPAFRADGSLPVTEDSGLVFVLVPGGKTTMGSQSTEPDHPYYERAPERELWEEPLSSVDLEPFLLSRYEMTQGQWLRLSAGGDPSYYSSADPSFEGLDRTYPVESVSREDCERLLRRYSLELPTEAQWERACRAGTTTRWFTGDEADTLAGHANVADQRALRFDPPWKETFAGFDDGCVIVCPVDASRPNPFGFQGMAGNVVEWCRDPWGSYTEATERGSGLRRQELAYSPRGVARGGSFQASPWFARSSARHQREPGSREADLGLRPARRIR